MILDRVGTKKKIPVSTSQNRDQIKTVMDRVGLSVNPSLYHKWDVYFSI